MIACRASYLVPDTREGLHFFLVALNISVYFPPQPVARRDVR